MPRNGLQERVFTLKTDIVDFLHTSSKMYVAVIDITDAFGSIDHELMIKELREVGYPEQVLEITRDIYTDSTLIIMDIYHALINALSAHIIHINLNKIFHTYVADSPTKLFLHKTLY